MSTALRGWLDRFFANYYRQHPVNATFIGVHDFDDRLPDYSPEGVADARAEVAALLHDVPATPSEPIDALDVRLARGALLIQQWEYDSDHFLRANPTVCTGEAIFGVIGLMLRGAPSAALSARLAAIPRLLEQGEALVTAAPAAWIERARRECRGARLLLEGSVGALAPEPAALALAACARYDAYLAALPQTERYAAGAEAFALLLREGHCLAASADDLERLALERMAEERDTLATLPAGEPRGPDAAGYAARAAELWTETRALAAEHDLLTVPDWPVHYVEQPAWARAAAPYLYFLPYRAPSPLDPPAQVDYFLPPFNAETSDSVLKLNHVVHHGSWGHHVQNWYAQRAPSRIGQIAAVDCAARIALLCGGTLAEGWACYATDLAEEIGFLDAADRRAHHLTRLRMAARTVVDVRLHHGRFSLAEGEQFYREQVGMSESAAHAEATKNSLFPATACMYLAGWTGIWTARREHQARAGAHFSLRAFHDRLLSMGSVPVSLAAEHMGRPVLTHH